MMASAKSLHLPSSLWYIWSSIWNVHSVMNCSCTVMNCSCAVMNCSCQDTQDAQGDALIQPAINDAGIAACVHSIAADAHPKSGMGCRCDGLQVPAWKMSNCAATRLLLCSTLSAASQEHVDGITQSCMASDVHYEPSMNCRCDIVACSAEVDCEVNRCSGVCSNYIAASRLCS